MLQAQIVCVGKLKERFFQEACAEYQKRLSRYLKLSIIEVADERAPASSSHAQIERIKAQEGERILSKLSEDSYAVALALDGPSFSSEAWADWFEQKMSNGLSKISFIIGGSNGLSPAVLARSDASLSFSSFTFSHLLMRVILLEQLYRAMKIRAGENYHK